MMNQKIPFLPSALRGRLKTLRHKFQTWFSVYKRKNQHSDGVIERLQQGKSEALRLKRLETSLMLILLALMFFQWKWGLGWLDEVDQLKNDLGEQAQVIEMERENITSLKNLENNHDQLKANIQAVYAALPLEDEEAESMLSMLEDVANKNRIILESIGIRKVPESQLNYQALYGVVDVYEYSFTVEADLPNILGFIASLRSSVRLMDIMAMEIESGQEGYRAGFLLHAYHLTKK